MRLLKIVGYSFLFIISFAYFFYKAIPYDIVKDRVLMTIERKLGNQFEIDVEELEPYYFTGIRLKKVEVKSREGATIAKLSRAHGRASIFSLLSGEPNVSFEVKMKKGEVSGYIRPNEDGWRAKLDFNNFNIGDIPLVKEKVGVDVSSSIDGSVRFSFNQKSPVRSEGRINLDLSNFQIQGGTLNVMGAEFMVPKIIISKRSGSEFEADIGKGVVDLKKFVLKNGDVELNVKGKVFLSNTVDNWRLNLNGDFGFSEKLTKEMTFLFILERQKRSDGKYPLDITGRIKQPIIKVGTFTVPM